ncbi:tetratricopeptide repeat protein [Streptomyces sp.]|uniref:tetratricopeptide repeat protein n=1 Tax=Streptomyces sp. TaxID=1931 RepID=UPI002F428374
MANELPPEPAHFVNRDEEKARAFRAVDDWRGRSRPLCLALSGPGGSGKTELAFSIARTLRDRFPDGVLYVDLDDFRSDGALDPADVLGQLLGSLGVGPEWLKHPFAARCRQYWTQTDGKRLLVIADNARYASEVVPLLPASGEAVVIVASHGPLYDLADGAAVDLVLPPLSDPHALELLRRVVPDRRLTADPEAARELVRLCSGLPAALHVAARWVRTHPLRSLSRLLAEVKADLDDKGVPLVERVWDAAYQDLDASAALLYRLLAGHPGTTFTRESAAALLGQGPDACDDALEALGAAGLLDTRDLQGAPDGRMRLPELLRAHARRRARQDAADGELDDAQHRLVRWYLRQAQRADLFTAGARLVVADAVAPLPGAPDVPLADPRDTGDPDVRAARTRDAARWLAAEHHTLFACVRLAHARGLDTEAWALCEPLWTYFLDHPHQVDVTEVFRLGAASAIRAGHISATVRMRCQLARPLGESDRTDEAARELDRALASLDLLGTTDRDAKLRASAMEFHGMLNAARGDWDAAAAAFAESREVHRAIPNPYGVLLQTYRLGEAKAALGYLTEAEHLLSEARTAAVDAGRARITARTGFALAGVLRRLGRPDEARPLYDASLSAARDRGSDFDEARVLDALAELATEQGRAAEAEDRRTAARSIRRRNGVT